MNKYVIVSDIKQSELESQVNDLISNGYVPCGGISVSRNPGHENLYTQAMVTFGLNHQNWSTELAGWQKTLEVSVAEYVDHVLSKYNTAYGEVIKELEAISSTDGNRLLTEEEIDRFNTKLLAAFE